MEIDVIYSKSDPAQKKTRDFIFRFVEERGLLARVREHEQSVQSMMLLVDGIALKEKREKPRPENPAPYPSIEAIARTLEQQAWT